MTEQSVETSKGPSVFVVMAYRWGQLNNHSYIVFAGCDRDEAFRQAKDERDGRGGKYGVSVEEYPSERVIGYFPSSGESETAIGPTENKELYVDERVGREVLRAYRHLTNTLSDVERLLVEKWPAGGELPSWLIDLCKRELAMHGLDKKTE